VTVLENLDDSNGSTTGIDKMDCYLDDAGHNIWAMMCPIPHLPPEVVGPILSSLLL
jgi:hypothetical protein